VRVRLHNPAGYLRAGRNAELRLHRQQCGRSLVGKVGPMGADANISALSKIWGLNIIVFLSTTKESPDNERLHGFQRDEKIDSMLKFVTIRHS
jgi:hypothetical protein